MTISFHFDDGTTEVIVGAQSYHFSSGSGLEFIFALDAEGRTLGGASVLRLKFYEIDYDA